MAFPVCVYGWRSRGSNCCCTRTVQHFSEHQKVTVENKFQWYLPRRTLVEVNLVEYLCFNTNCVHSVKYFPGFDSYSYSSLCVKLQVSEVFCALEQKMQDISVQCYLSVLVNLNSDLVNFLSQTQERKKKWGLFYITKEFGPNI